MLRIGITPGLLPPDPNRSVFAPKTLSYLESELAIAFTSKTSYPVLIPFLSDQKLELFLQNLDALVLQGGSDMAPATHKSIPIDPNRWPGDSFRDHYEIKILKHFTQTNKPILGICRGLQVLNVFFNGNLIQDIPSQFQSSIVHRDKDLYDKIYHSVDILPNGHLSKMYPNQKSIQVNSVHHQGILKLGDGLTIEAKSSDGLIEAFSAPNYPGFLMGLQWHPEFSQNQKEMTSSAPIINYFFKQVEKHEK